MPRTESKATVNNFVGGLVSDYHELNNPPNTTVDEDNCDLDRKGSRKRRLGIDFEEGATASVSAWTEAEWATIYTKVFEWDSVNEDGEINFLVVQGGSTLSFYDMNFSTLAEGELPFTVELEDFRAPAYLSTASFPVQVASGKGALFVVGEAINPFYIQYNEDTNTLSTTILSLKVRDLALQDHTLSYIDQVASVTPQQKYDLFNQGWNNTCRVDSLETSSQANKNVFDWYKAHSKDKKYPPKSKSWWLGKVVDVNSGLETFDPGPYDNVYVGNQLAPLGTYILDAFNKDRAAVSGIAGLSVEIESSRPAAVAFGSGRVFYGFRNKLLFSQVIEDDFKVAENCFQAADPTAEKLSDLVATDGGIIQIIDSSNIFSLFAFENAIFAFSASGVWSIGGSAVGSGFSATDFSIYKVTEVGALNSRSLISVEGTPVWWSKLGIYMLQGDPAKQGYSAVNILEKKLQLFYNAIPPLSKTRATGAYDRTKKVVTWLYNSTAGVLGNNLYVGDTLLNYDTVLQAFYKYSISDTGDGNSPYITDVFNVFDVVAEVSTEDVVDNGGFTILNNALQAVEINVAILGNSGNTNSSLKFLTFWKGA